MLNLSGADAAINCWNDKYHFDFWRPWQAIREADVDGNPATEPDPTWTPLLTAPYPEHPSGHLCLDGAHLGVLQMFFGTDEIAFDVTSSRFGGETRHFDRFSRAARGDHRSPHLGGPPLPHGRRAGGEPRQQRRRLHGGPLLPATPLSEGRRSRRGATPRDGFLAARLTRGSVTPCSIVRRYCGDSSRQEGTG